MEGIRRTDGDHGRAIRFEMREAPRGAVRLRKECNLRVKRQDPSFKANDPAERDADLGLKEWMRNLSRTQAVFGTQSTAVESCSGQRSLTQQAFGGNTGSGSRCGTGTDSQSSLRVGAASGNWQPTPLDGWRGRPMPVNRGKRAWRAPTPHLLTTLRGCGKDTF